MDENAYRTSLTTKSMEELTTELQNLQNQLDMVFTVNNSLDDTDITEGGGDPEMQARYQDTLTQRRCVNEEINKRHMLEALDGKL